MVIVRSACRYVVCEAVVGGPVKCVERIAVYTLGGWETVITSVVAKCVLETTNQNPSEHYVGFKIKTTWLINACVFQYGGVLLIASPTLTNL